MYFKYHNLFPVVISVNKLIYSTETNTFSRAREMKINH